MKPAQFNLGQEVLRATEAWLAANQVGVPESIKNAAPQTRELPSNSQVDTPSVSRSAVAAPISLLQECREMIVLNMTIEDDDELLAKQDALMSRLDAAIAQAAPLSGPCIECHQETEDRHGGDFMHDGCAEQLNEEYERDCRLDSPTHSPYGRRR